MKTQFSPVLNQNKTGRTADRTSVRPKEGTVLTVAAVRQGVLSPGRTKWRDPVSFVLTPVSLRLRLAAEGHDGGGGVGSGGHVLAVGEAVQVLTGGVNGAVDRTFGGAAHAVLLCLVQVVGDTGVCRERGELLSPAEDIKDVTDANVPL